MNALYDAPVDLNGDTKNIIKVYESDDTRSYMKAQCMHCVDPACVSACPVGALGTDSIARSLEVLFGQVMKLRAHGLSALMYSGSYRVPPDTLTGDIARITQVYSSRC